MGGNKLALIIQSTGFGASLNSFNITLETNINEKPSTVRANIAIAAAVTAYARIHMMDLKLHSSCYYTDTDSIFVDDLEPFKHLIGKELGQLKLELDGATIQEAEFLGIKQYGYWYLDSNNNRVENSTVAGVARNTIPFEDIKKLQTEQTLTIGAMDRFYKSLINLDIKIANHKMSITKANNKKLINNNYTPINININN